MEHTVAIILGGGHGSRLYPLTKRRSKPAVPFGGMYRIIDIPVSNCLNSGIYQIFVATQFNSASLNRHVALTYTFDTFREGFVTILAAEQTPENADWYQGTADAVRKNLRHIRPTGAEDVLVLSGDHIYRMDYRVMVAAHRQHRADVTIAALPIPASDVSRFGVLRTSPSGKVTEFREKPKSSDPLTGWELPFGLFSNGSGKGEPVYLASMGIYLIAENALENMLQPDSGKDFGMHVIPRAIETHRVFAFPFTGYWEDIGTIRTYYESNLALTDDNPQFDVFDPQMKLFTRPRFLPGARMGKADIRHSLVCAGVRAGEVKVNHSVLGTRTSIQSGVTIEDSYIAGADFYENEDVLRHNREQAVQDVGIGGDTVIRRAIVDKNARIGYGVTIDPGENCPDIDGDGYAIRDGIAIIEKNAVIPDGSVIPERA